MHKIALVGALRSKIGWTLMLKMPKGADLHNHLSGAIYAERYVEWAAEKGLCINTRTMTLSVPAPPSKCDPKSEQPPASMALTNSVLYRQMIDAWSMRNWQLSDKAGTITSWMPLAGLAQLPLTTVAECSPRW